jgi:glycosyltransferase involved in cell wall biosynthesis
MKILMVAPVPFFVERGTPIRILEEALALEKEGVDIDIVTYHLGRNIGEIREKTKIRIYRIARLLFWYNKKEAGADWQKVILDILLIWKISKIVFLKKPKIIHAHLHEGVLAGWVVKKIFFWRDIKLVADFHGGLVSEMESHGYLNGGLLKNIFRFLEKSIFSLGDWTITSSSELKERVINLRKKNNNVSVVLDGVNLDKYKIKRRGEISDNNIKVIYSGSFVKNKGIDLLLKSIKEISQMNIKNISFILAGSPVVNIQDFIRKNNLEGIVQIISPLEYNKLPEINQRGDIGIDPKTSEVGQASGKILQYMAAGLPVICFDRKNNHKYLGEAGYYIKENSTEKVVSSILDLMRNPDKINTMSRISKKRSADFSWEKSAKKIIKIYNKVNNPS